jgi:hypothetical protein
MSTPEPSPWIERRYADLQLHVRMRKDHMAGVEYEVRELTFYDDGDGDPLKFSYRPAEGCGVTTQDVEKADVWLCGTIKFDGCSHNNFGDTRGYIHGCQREHLTRLGPLFDRLFDWTIELIGDDGKYLCPSPL